MKRKLFFLLALMLGLVSGIQARTDVTSTYLTDAALENEGTNWALVSNGGNHAWDGTNKYHESWHNTFTITQTTEALPAGYYQLSIQAAVEGGNSTTISLQATSGSNSSVAVYPKYSTHSSYADMAAWWAADANHTGNRNLSRIFTTVYVEEGQTLTATFKQTANNQWFVYGQVQLHQLTDAEGRYAQIFEAAYNSRTNQDMASGRYKQRFESYTAGTVTGKKLTKTISGLPKGKYNVTLNGGASYTSGRGFDGNTGDNLTEFYANNATTNVTVVDRAGIGNQEFTDYTASNGLVSDGNLEVGYNNKEIGANWFVGSVKYIELAEPYISVIATEIPAATATTLTANEWYKFTAASTGDYAFDANNVDNIIYTTADQLPSIATGSPVPNDVMALTEGTTYYFKSSTAQTLTITPQTFVYVVGSATSDISYIQSGKTVTVSYESMSTDNPAPHVVKNFSGVTFDGNAISVTPTSNGFTFTAPTVAVGTEHTLRIPAGSIGYSDGAGIYNEAQDITLKTPAVFDGTYYFKVENEGGLKGQYLSRGKNYGTHATVDKYGLAIKVVTDGQNRTTLKPYDTDKFYRVAENKYECWADNTDNDDRAKFNLVSYNGHILVHGITTTLANDYFKYNDQDISETTKIWADSHGTDDSNGHAIEFSLEDADTQAAAMQALKDGQAATASSAAYASGNYASLNGITTVSELESALSSYIQGDFVPPTEVTSVLEKYEGSQPGSGNTVETVYSNSINITEPGFYKFSMQAFYRAGSNPRTQEMHAANIDRSPVVLFFGEAETQIKSVYDESSETQIVEDWGDVVYNDAHYPNNMDASLKMFQNDHYHNNVYVYISTPGEYSYGVKYLGFASANAQWFIYSPESVEITSYAAAADAADYTALQNAIEAYDAATWGFEKDEYAPYNNVEAISNIAAAKAINPLETNSKLLVNSLTGKLTLTANATEVNAVGNGNFGIQENFGWEFNAWGQFVSGLNSNTNASNGTARSSNAGTLTYGNTTGYTMPLKANTVYRLTFKVSSWDDSNKNTGTDVSVLNGSSEGLATKSFGASNKNRDVEGAFIAHSVEFKTGAAGDYTLVITAKGQRSVYTDIDLRIATATAKMQVSGIAKMGTFCAPFDVEIPSGVKAYTLSEGTNESWVHMNEVEGPKIAAGTPVLLTSDEKVDTEVEGQVSVLAPDNSGLLQGAFVQTDVPNNDGNYLLQYQDGECAFYLVNSDGKQIGANRCYLHIEKSGETLARIAIGGEDGPTGINEIEAIGAEAKTMKDGKYLVKGRIVLVKSGNVFDVNGQLLK